MRVIRSSGQNISPSDDGALYNEIFSDGLFEATSIESLGSNQVSIGAMYGIMQGREFTNSAETINVILPSGGEGRGYIYIEYDLASDPIGSIKSALAPFTPTYQDLNSTGTLAQMIIAEYTASAVAITDISATYEIASVYGSSMDIPFTLLSTGWQNDGTNDLYQLTDAHITPDKDITLTYPPTLSDAQFEAYQDATIRPWGAVQNGSMWLKAVNGVPEIDLPIILVVEG